MTTPEERGEVDWDAAEQWARERIRRIVSGYAAELNAAHAVLVGGEQAREIERLRDAMRWIKELFSRDKGAYRSAMTIIDEALSGASDVNHGMAVHGPGGVNSQSTSGEAQKE
jgi:hypothetical protein